MNVGIDEAGRGPVFGPLVVAAVWLTQEQEQQLRDAGVKDSKQVSEKNRSKLFELINSNAAHIEIQSILPSRINHDMQNGISLTQIEVNSMKQLLQLHTAQQAIIDCPSTNCQAIADQLKTVTKAQLVVEHKADQNHISAAAASIIAKVTRDQAIQELQQTYGDIGSGYPSDPKTKQFIQHEYDPSTHNFIRTQWETVKRLKKHQNSLDQWT